jgi:nitroreductase
MGLDTLYSRRSIRSFTGEPVSAAQEAELLKAAMAAPSSMNARPWHFIVVRERATLNAIAAAHPHASMLREATLSIAVCGDPAVNGEYWIQDCAAATQNILLAATALGLGSCWLGMHPRPDRKAAVRDILNIPAPMEILSLVALGHPGESKPPRTQFDPARVHRERW